MRRSKGEKSVITEVPERIRERWTHKGIECAIMLNPFGSSYNGYVRVPEAKRSGAGAFSLKAHGGITYKLDEEGWTGFDTGHAFDYWPDLPDLYGAHEFLAREPYRIEWTLEKLREEVNGLAEQVAALAEGKNDARRVTERER